MKIIIVGTAYPFRGGLAAFSEKLARELQKEGHEVEIFTFTTQYPSFLFPGKSQFSSEPQPTDLTIHQSMSSLNPFTWVKTGKVIRKKAPDKIIFCYWMAFIAPCFGSIARFARNKKTKMIALIHNMIPHEPTILDKLFPPYFVNSMDGFVAMTNSVVNDIKKFDKAEKPKVVSPHPIYDHYGEIITKTEAAMRLGLHDQNRYILFFGFIRQYKGLDLLLEAFADKRLRDLPVKLIVAGEFYENPQPYWEQIARLQLENHIELRTLFVPDRDVRNYFCVADLIAQPYRSGSQSGITQIAYHFEKPMLVTNVGGIGEIVEHDKVGYAVEVNPKQIADALVDFFTTNKSKDFIKNIRIQKQKFSWSVMTDSIYKLTDQDI
jgi:D-inositol-3-phosphate glycosyltransferase